MDKKKSSNGDRGKNKTTGIYLKLDKLSECSQEWYTWDGLLKTWDDHKCWNYQQSASESFHRQGW